MRDFIDWEHSSMYNPPPMELWDSRLVKPDSRLSQETFDLIDAYRGDSLRRAEHLIRFCGQHITEVLLRSAKWDQTSPDILANDGTVEVVKDLWGDPGETHLQIAKKIVKLEEDHFQCGGLLCHGLAMQALTLQQEGTRGECFVLLVWKGQYRRD